MMELVLVMSDNYRKLVQQNIDRMGVQIENRNPRYPQIPQIDTPNNLLERTSDDQRKASRNVGLPPNNKALGREDHRTGRLLRRTAGENNARSSPPSPGTGVGALHAAINPTWRYGRPRRAERSWARPTPPAP
jgi:hypothetical protein